MALLSLLLAAAATANADWNISQAPVHLYGNTYYVGVHGLGSILLTSPQGLVLIDGGLPESAPKIAANVQALGYRLTDIKLILNTHVHQDHAGGIAELQQASGATVAATAPAAKVLQSGRLGPDDPQYGSLAPIRAIAKVTVVHDGETLHVGPLALTAHTTPGHTPGGTTWTWQSCEHQRCLNIVYADSLTSVSADQYRFSDHPEVLKQFAGSFAKVAALPCDILLTPHPGASDLWERLDKRTAGDAGALIDSTACKRYAESAQAGLDERVAKEKKKK